VKSSNLGGLASRSPREPAPSSYPYDDVQRQALSERSRLSGRETIRETIERTKRLPPSPRSSRVKKRVNAFTRAYEESEFNPRAAPVADTLETLVAARSVSDLTHRSVLHYANASSIVIFIQFKLHVARLLKDTQILSPVVAIRRDYASRIPLYRSISASR